MRRSIVLPRQAGRTLSALGGLLVLMSPAGAQAQLLRGILDPASGSSGVLGTGVTVGTTTLGSGLAGTGLTVGTAAGGVLGTGATVGTTAPGSGLAGTGLTVGTTNGGLLGTGVTASTTGPGDGLLRTGLNIGTSGGDPCSSCGTGGRDRTQTVVNELRLSSTAYAVATNNASGLASATATGGDATALGYGATATGTGSVAVGSGAAANQGNTVAIGAGARTTRENQIVIGNSANTYTLPGIASQASAAAQSGATQFVTTDAGGNLAASPYGPSTIAGLGNRVDALEAKTDALRQYAVESRREARQGVATAMAMTTASMPSAPGRTSWVMNTATFRGEWAGGVAVAHRLPTCCVPLAITAGYATSGGNNHGVRAGLAGEF